MKKLDYSLVFVCGLIEHIGRQKKLPREEVIEIMGSNLLKNYYEYADVFHCMSLEDNLSELEEQLTFPQGDYINHLDSMFKVPSEYQVGKVYTMIIQELFDDPIDGIYKLYNSFLAKLINDYNTHTIFTPIDELVLSYKEGILIE